jgi:hypothetical protein
LLKDKETWKRRREELQAEAQRQENEWKAKAVEQDKCLKEKLEEVNRKVRLNRKRCFIFLLSLHIDSSASRKIHPTL